ncbi:MAG TPA: DinB family protein [Bryobacteraceae bacterium]|nr:DinB family protein [Bryobacteraceae bacterium]
MAAQLAQYLRSTIDREFPVLSAVTDEQASRPAPTPGSWNAKQELGHLLDSAANNHQRFVRATLHGPYQGPGYAQDDWVRLHAYDQLPWATIVALWQQYNLFLVHLIEQIPDDALDTPCNIGSYEPSTLGFVIDDYVLHMQHHLDHLLMREFVTKYPR